MYNGMEMRKRRGEKKDLTVEQENADLLINVVKDKKVRVKMLLAHSIFSLNYSSHKSEGGRHLEHNSRRTTH